MSNGYLKNGSGLIYFVLFIDQLTKRFFYQIGVLEICQYFVFYPSWNKGVSFSMLSSWQPIILIILIIFMLFYVGWMLKNTINKWQKIALNLILSGGLGNLLDRIFFGGVFDFILVRYEQFFFPIFNVADIAVSIGAFLLFLTLFLKNKPNKLANVSKNRYNKG